MTAKDLWIGSYTPQAGAIGRGTGIYRVPFDPETGRFGRIVEAANTPCPSWLLRHPTVPILYCVNELARGSVSAFRIEADGKLRPLGSRATWYTTPDAPPHVGDHPCHLTLDPSARLLLASNYGSGMLSIHPLVGPESRQGQGEFEDGGEYLPGDRDGFGPDPERQGATHAHSALVLPDGVTVLVADLGADRLRAYRLDPQARRLRDTRERVVLPPASGPRHMIAHPNGFLYVSDELDSTIARLTRNIDGEYELVDTIAIGHATDTADPQAPTPPRPYPAHIRTSPDGRFLYTTVRGTNLVAVHEVHPDGALHHVVDAPTGGSNPRHFTIQGPWLLIAHQDSDDVVVHALDPITGIPTPTNERLTVPSPVCLLPETTTRG